MLVMDLFLCRPYRREVKTSGALFRIYILKSKDTKNPKNDKKRTFNCIPFYKNTQRVQ